MGYAILKRLIGLVNKTLKISFFSRIYFLFSHVLKEDCN